MLTKFRMKSEKGFTLIELLIVVAIIGILAAIAIPQFNAYRKRGYNAAANSDLRSVRTTQEAMMADFADYGASANAATDYGAAAVEKTGTVILAGGKTSTTGQSVSLSPNVYVGVKANTNTAGTARTAYTAVTTNSNGDQYYAGDSDVTILYRKGWSGTYNAAGSQTLGVVPTSVKDQDDFATAGANWTQMQ
jgi:prepilin-type N-terminal cleavage/methylation domain-containing protein